MAMQMRAVARSAQGVRSISSSASRAATPITEPWPGIPELKPFDMLEPPTTRITTLPNGLRVASEEKYGQAGCVALMLDAGCMYEPADKRGIGHMLDTLVFSGSERFPADQIVPLIQKHGLSALSLTSRDVMMSRVDAFRGSIPTAVAMLADNLLQPTLAAEDLARARATIGFQDEDFRADPSQVISEVLHEAAYGAHTPLGTSQFATLENVQGITEDDLRDHLRRMVRPERAVLAGAGVDHDELVAIAEAEFGHLGPAAPGEEPYPAPDQTYKGGIVSRSVPLAEGQPGPLMSHMSVAFPTIGWKDKRVIAMCVMDTLLGGGSSFSAGGPGKGMYTRLYREVLNRHGWVDQMNAFSITGDNQGLFGLYGATTPDYAGSLCHLILEQQMMLLDRKADATELDRARNQLRSTVLMNLESRAILCEDIGRQVLTLGERMDVDELCDRISAVSSQDLQDVAQSILSQKPSIALLNGVADDRLYDDIADAFARKTGGMST